MMTACRSIGKPALLSPQAPLMALEADFAALLPGTGTPHQDHDRPKFGTSTGCDAGSSSKHADSQAQDFLLQRHASPSPAKPESDAVSEIFSIALVTVLWPILATSSYGANVRHMPDIEGAPGYSPSLKAMSASAIIPFLFFRWKGWL